MKNFTAGPKWLLGVVTRKRGPVAVEVKLEDGRYMRRNFDYIRANRGTTPPTVPAVKEKSLVPADKDVWYEGHSQPQ